MRISGLSTGGVRASVVSLLYPSADLISLDPKAETVKTLSFSQEPAILMFFEVGFFLKSCKDLRLTRLHVPST